MGDVSNYATSEYGSADYQLIMSGGAHWMARMTAFLEAQEQAQAAIVKSGIVGDIVAAQKAARLDRETAAKELEDARGFADGIVSQAEAQADQLLANAKAEAEKIIAAANDAATVTVAAAEDRLNAARSKMDKAQSTASHIATREAALEAQLANLNKQADEVAEAKAEADAVRARYQAFAEKLRAVLAEEPA